MLGRALGHANEAMTGHYQHVDDALLHTAVEAVADTWRVLDGEVCPLCAGTGLLPAAAKDASG